MLTHVHEKEHGSGSNRQCIVYIIYGHKCAQTHTHTIKKYIHTYYINMHIATYVLVPALSRFAGLPACVNACKNVGRHTCLSIERP